MLPVKFLFWILLWLVSKLVPIQYVPYIKYTVIKISWQFNWIFLDQTHVSFNPSQWFFLLMTAVPQRTRYARHSIYGPWTVDGVDSHSCFILNYEYILWSPHFIGINCLDPFITTRLSFGGKWAENNDYYVIYIKYSTHHLASWSISSPRDVAPLTPREISASLSLLDCEWQNLRVSIVLESILWSKGQFASSKLSINRDTWATPVVMI